MALAKKKRKGPPPKPERPRIPTALLLRMFVLGSVAVVAAVWAIHRYYTVPRRPMRVPVESPTEMPAPELVPAE